MSIDLDLFIAAESSLSETASELQNALNVPFEPSQDGTGSSAFKALRNGVTLTLMVHDLETDRNLDFENYRYQLAFQFPDTRESAKEYAIEVFDVLSEKTSCRLLLSEDVQVELLRRT